jgi:glycerophosphoryl diester phosphodiesterase
VQYLRKQVANLRLAALTAQQPWLANIHCGQPGVSSWTAGLNIDAYEGCMAHLMHALGADVWSPHYKDINTAQVKPAQALGLQVAVWTLNNIAAMHHVLSLGVDSMITDYPDRLITLLKQQGARS